MNYLLPPQVNINEHSARVGVVSNLFIDLHANPEAISKVKIGLVGVPFDEGIIAGGGRAGASKGPDAIRLAFKRMGTTYFIEQGIDISNVVIADFGDVDIVPNNPTETYQRISYVIKEILDQGIIPVTLGGGHDISHATVRGLAAHLQNKPLGGINIDAHLDVREPLNRIITSGCPFRVALESIASFKAADFTTIGVTGNSNAKVYFDYLYDKGAKTVSLNQLRERGIKEVLAKALPSNPMFLSIDIDVVSQSFAPGCSAPALIGMNPEELAEIAFLVGKSKKAKIVDMVEVNPSFDQDSRTARLAAYTILQFIAGHYN